MHNLGEKTTSTPFARPGIFGTFIPVFDLITTANLLKIEASFACFA